MKRFIILFLVLSGCNLLDPPTHVTEELQPFYDRVVYEYEIRGVKVKPIKVVFGNISTRGKYDPWPVWDKKILIDRSFFNENIGVWDYNILKTVAHEIGHHMGRNKHDNRVFEVGDMKGLPKSLMCNDRLVYFFEQNQEYYFDELVGVKLNSR